jgi:uncharacterized membrane protein
MLIQLLKDTKLHNPLRQKSIKMLFSKVAAFAIMAVEALAAPTSTGTVLAVHIESEAY